jgi:hypothetical protein
MARCFEGACCSALAGSALSLDERSVVARLVLGVGGALWRAALLGAFSSEVKEGVSFSNSMFSDSVFSKAVWVNRLARWVGAGGSGMNKGLLRMEKRSVKKQKAAWRPRRLFVWEGGGWVSAACKHYARAK